MVISFWNNYVGMTYAKDSPDSLRRPQGCLGKREEFAAGKTGRIVQTEGADTSQALMSGYSQGIVE